MRRIPSDALFLRSYLLSPPRTLHPLVSIVKHNYISSNNDSLPGANL